MTELPTRTKMFANCVAPLEAQKLLVSEPELTP
jgi:hypothetical protein